MKYSVVSIGEPIIDFVETPSGDALKKAYVSNAGGGAANVLAACAAMGGKPAMLGRVGNDIFGDYLVKSLQAVGIDATGIKMDDLKPTGIGFVYHLPNGERQFLFYRDNTTQVVLYDHDNEAGILADCQVYHYTSVSLVQSSLLESTFEARDVARGFGKPISFDVNYRPRLWSNGDRALQIIMECAQSADIVKLSREEMELLFPGCTPEECATRLLQATPALVCISLGEEGCFYATHAYAGRQKAPVVAAIDTTGCGDALMGSMLQLLSDEGVMNTRALRCLPRATLCDAIALAVCSASICATRLGSLECMPTKREAQQMLASL